MSIKIPSVEKILRMVFFSRLFHAAEDHFVAVVAVV